ncbi:hypothetical protein [Litorivivens sp.]|uniref:hypothetical protein n=1 Tax=Litorivivens sp. TaxID=2020868 RepID=UPI0035626B1F
MKQKLLEEDINRLGFWSVIAAFALALASGFFPLDAPGGAEAVHADRAAWLSANGGSFIMGWLIQIAWMSAWTATMFVLCWMVFAARPIRALIAAMFVLVSFVAFIIPKFIAVWTIPQLGDAIVDGGAGAEMADALLLILNVSIPYSLYTSLDYLGFWMYALFSLMIAGPLFEQAAESRSIKIAAVALGLFGLIWHVMMIAVFMDAAGSAAIEIAVAAGFLLILIAFVAAAIKFKSAM